MNPFTNYHDWRTTMIKRAKLTLDRDYGTERLAILEDENALEIQFSQPSRCLAPSSTL